MGQVTYFVAMAVNRLEGDYVAAVEPKEAQTADRAVRLARSLAETHDGAIAFSRTGDPERGDWEDAVELARFGDVPNDLLSLAL